MEVSVNGWFECPVCFWRVTDIEYLSIMVDHECPGCCTRKLSEFRYVTDDPLLTREEPPR